MDNGPRAVDNKPCACFVRTAAPGRVPMQKSRLASRFSLLALVAASQLFAGPSTPIRRLESEMLRLVNHDRVKYRLKPLTLDAELSTMARAHSKDMCRGRFFGHVSPNTGSMADRFFKAGIAASRSTENVALNQSVRAAQLSLMHSPGHRKNLLDPKVTHIGIGIFQGPGRQLYFTQNFMQPMPKIDLASAPDELFKAINEIREARKRKPLERDPDLDELCLANSQQMYKDGKLNGDAANKKLKRFGRKMRKYFMFFHYCKTWETLLEIDRLSDADLTHLGVGLVRGEKKDGYGMLWVTLLIAKQR